MADSLPGVAIAISLVPPICVAGIALAEGEWTAEYGAMLMEGLSVMARGANT